MPAVRRRCSHGVHKDRRFYVCGLERSQRCNYFKWADALESAPSTAQDDGQVFSRDDAQHMFIPVQMELQKIFSENGLQEQFCSLVSNQFENQSNAAAPVVSLEVNSGVIFPSIKSELERMQDKNDGVHRSLEKFGKSTPLPIQLNDDDSLPSTDGTKESFLCTSLDLFSLLAPKRKSSSEVTDTMPWTADWFSVLCQIISTGTLAQRHFAKSMLQVILFFSDIFHSVFFHWLIAFIYTSLFLFSVFVEGARTYIIEFEIIMFWLPGKFSLLFLCLCQHNVPANINCDIPFHSFVSFFSGHKIFLIQHLLFVNRPDSAAQSGERRK